MKLNRYFYAGVALLIVIQGCAMTPEQASEDSVASESVANNESGQDSESSDQPGTFPHKKDIIEELETDVPPHLIYKLLVAEIAGQRGEMELAVKNYLEVAQETRDPKVAARASQVAIYAKDMDSALAASSLWVSIEEDNPDAHRNLASAYIRVARPVDAVKHYEKMLELLHDENKPGHGFSVISSTLAREPDRELAMSVMDKLIQTRKDNPYAMFAYAHLAMRQARFEMALNALDDALNVKSDWTSAIILRSRILAMQGARGEALSYLENVLKGDMSDNIEVGLTYARMLTESRQLEKALEQFKRLADLDERNVEINYYAGVLALQLQKLDPAEEYLQKVMKLGKRLQETNYYLGQIAEQRKDFEGAINRYSFVRHGEFYFNAQLRVVSVLADQKKFDRSIEHLQTIRVNSSKQRLQLILLEGDLLRESNRYAAAKDFYTKVLAQMPNETSVRYARALVAEKLGELDLLESDLQTILKMEPSNAQVLNALGYTLADRTDRYDEALKYIQRAIELEPDDAAVVDSMGWVYYRMGNYEQSIKHLRRANELSKDPEIAAHLGEVLWANGQKDEAAQIWENSLKDHPDEKVLIDVMRQFGL